MGNLQPQQAPARRGPWENYPMQAFLSVARAIDRATEAIGKLVMWAIFAAVIVSAGNAIVRKAFNMASNT